MTSSWRQLDAMTSPWKYHKLLFKKCDSINCYYRHKDLFRYFLMRDQCYYYLYLLPRHRNMKMVQFWHDFGQFWPERLCIYAFVNLVTLFSNGIREKEVIGGIYSTIVCANWMSRANIICVIFVRCQSIEILRRNLCFYFRKVTRLLNYRPNLVTYRVSL